MKTKFTILFLISFLLLLNSCDTKRRAKGREDEIIIVADSTEYMQLKDVLKQTFGKIIYTPQPEELFKIKRKSINALEEIKRKKNIVIVAPINSGSYTSQYLNKVLDSNVKELVKKDSAYVINKYDLWAKDQLVMILTAPNIDTLKNRIIQKKDELLYYFTDFSNKRIARGLYNPKFEQKDIEAKLLSKYGWILYIQADYKLAMERPEDNFVWLRRGVNSDMERWVFVHWIDNASPEFLNKDSIAIERDKMTVKYYRTSDDKAYVIHYDDYKITKEVNFNGRYAIMTQGLWRFNDNSGGGPFVNYTFYDEDTKRIYMLDASIFAPKYLKKSIIQQVDVLLHSFKTEKEINPERKKEILEELEN